VDSSVPAATPATGSNTPLLIGLAALALLFLFKKH
jgi:LPXTG-motif cell wall-anchored protein